MKLVSYLHDNASRLGLYQHGKIIDLHHLDPQIPCSMAAFLEQWDQVFPRAQAIADRLPEGGIPEDEVYLLAPVPQPRSCRDGYAFRQHVEAARRNRKVSMIEEFDQFPIFYFTNHQSIQGPGRLLVCLITSCA